MLHYCSLHFGTSLHIITKRKRNTSLKKVAAYGSLSLGLLSSRKCMQQTKQAYNKRFYSLKGIKIVIVPSMLFFMDFLFCHGFLRWRLLSFCNFTVFIQNRWASGWANVSIGWCWLILIMLCIFTWTLNSNSREMSHLEMTFFCGLIIIRLTSYFIFLRDVSHAFKDQWMWQRCKEASFFRDD